MIKFAKKLIDSIENSPASFWLWLAAFTSIVTLRLLIENWLEHFRNRSGSFIFYEFTHTFLFFLISYILFAILINKALKVEIKKASNLLLWGFLIITTPPILDYIISGGKGYWSFYKFDSLIGLAKRFFTFFGDKPEIGITYGVRIEAALAVIFFFIYGYIKSKNVIRSLFLSLISYFLLFILGTFPSYITIIFRGFTKGFTKVTDIDIAQMFLTPVKILSREIPDIISSLNIRMSIIYSLILAAIVLFSLFFCQKDKFIVFLKNARFPQLIYHNGLILAGIGLACIFTDITIEIDLLNIASILLLLISVTCAWLASVVINDIEDKSIDEITNINRPLVRGIISLNEYKIIGWMLFTASLLFSAIVNFKIVLFFVVYQAIAWIYSCWPLRLKRFAFISTFVSAIASLMILFSGFILVSPEQNIKSMPFYLIALLVVGCTLSLPVKDFKDIEGDRKNGVYTVPVLFGEYWGKIIVGAGIFVSFLLSVVIFNEFRLFWWALLCGAISFWIILSSEQNKNIVYKKLPWWILGIVTIYGIVLVKIIFF